MTSARRLSLIAASLLLAGAAHARSPAAGCDPMGAHGAGPWSDQMASWQQGAHHGQRQAWIAKREAALKTLLKLTPAQEGAWATFTGAMKAAPATAFERPDPAELARLSTPERLDRMKALRAQHLAAMTTAMDQRADAVKAFYAVLTPEQQKVFDADAMPRLERATMRHHGPRGS